ncbi:MAG: carboxypeptidase-like regulatory domain-containing protein, partial [Rikenellaceae bacterium]
MLCNTVAFGQTIKIGGNVKDKQNLPLIGTVVIEKGTDNGTVVDYDGNYLLSVSSSSATLVFQYIGYITQEQEISSRSTIDVVMVEDALSLGEVVGYGSVKRGDLTTAVSTVSTEDLDTRPITSASGALQGKAAGVQVIQSNTVAFGQTIKIGGNVKDKQNLPLIGTVVIEKGTD